MSGWIVCIIIITVNFLLITIKSSCSVSFNKQLQRESDIRLIGGYNDALGAVNNLTYLDDGLILTTRKLYNGILRYPGGTPANYWYFKNASYVQPCNTSEYDYCHHQSVVAKLPPQTFSPANFSKGVGISSPTISTKNKMKNSIVFDLNILTLYNDSLIEQLDPLKNEIGPENIRYIELGNEYYLTDYQYEFPNVSIYIEKALPVINEIRNSFPDTKISVPTYRMLPNSSQVNEWNEQLIKFNSLFDSVTVHDYSLTPNLIGGLDKYDQLSYISIYGISVIPQRVEYVRNKFGKNKTIWMTEYNINPNVINATNGYTVLHSMFALSYITAAVCDPTQTMELLGLHLYASQIGNWWGPYDYVTLLSGQANDKNGTFFDVVGQILGQLGYISFIKNSQMTCLDFGTDCPKLDLDVVNTKNLGCLFGMGFNDENDGNSFGFVIVNACSYKVGSIEFELELDSVSNGRNKNVMLDMYEYFWYGQGGSRNKFVDCGENGNVWDKSCAAVYGNYTQINIGANQQTLTVNISALSVILAVVE